MGRATVTVGRPLTTRARRRNTRRSLVAAAVVPTYDMLYGSQCGLLFESACLEAGFRNVDNAWWPTEARALHAEGAVFREGQHGALYRLDDGTLVLAHLTEDAIRLSIAGPSRASVEQAGAAFAARYPASYVTTEGDSRVPITFWANSQFGPRPRLRRIDATSWEPIVGNYSAEVRDQLEELMAWKEPGVEGQLILWQGPPGTGKTWALRALASEWAPWAEFNYITDPDSFFVDDPSYMVEVLLSDSYSVMDAADGSVFEEQAEGKWRVLILEDTGELLSANAKEKYGQGLSRLLNVVDGMIGQGLRVLCLVTTNDELGELNEAVRRPGRCASQIVFGPLSDEEAQAWTGTPDATAGTIAELYSKYGRATVEARDASFTEEPEDARDLMASARPVFPRPIRTHDDAIDEGIAWGEYHAGRAPKPVIAAAADVRAEIARVAEAHAPDGGYGETAWHAGDRVVFWVSADWTTNEEAEAAEQDFLAIDGVDALEHDAEAALPNGDGWEQVWPNGDSSLAAIVALASEPLVIEVEPELVAAVTEAIQPPPLEVPLTTSALIDVLGKFAERDLPPAPTFNLHFPQHLGVTLERQDISIPVTVEPAPPTPLEVHSHVEVPAQEPPNVTVLAADPAPVQVDVHVPAQPPATVVVQERAAPSAVRVDFDEDGRTVYVPIHDEPPEATT